MNRNRAKFFVNRRNLFARIAFALLIVSVILLIIGTVSVWSNTSKLITEFILPAAACVIMILFIELPFKNIFVASFIPVAAGCVYFALGLLGGEFSAMTAVKLLICLIVLIVYAMTVLGKFRTKWILLPVSVLALVFRILVDDASFFSHFSTLTMKKGALEFAKLAMLASLILVSAAMRRNKKPEEGPQGPAPDMPVPPMPGDPLSRRSGVAPAPQGGNTPPSPPAPPAPPAPEENADSQHTPAESEKDT